MILRNCGELLRLEPEQVDRGLMGVDSPEECEGEVMETNGTTNDAGSSIPKITGGSQPNKINCSVSSYLKSSNILSDMEAMNLKWTNHFVITVIFEMFLEIRFIPVHFATLGRRSDGILVASCEFGRSYSFGHVGSASSAHGANQ